jgi:hypothetical protein
MSLQLAGWSGTLWSPNIGGQLFIGSVDLNGVLSNATLDNQSVIGSFNTTTNEISFWLQGPAVNEARRFDGYAWSSVPFGIVMAGTMQWTVFIPRPHPFPPFEITVTVGWFAGVPPIM